MQVRSRASFLAVALCATIAAGSLYASDPIWSDAAHSHALWISGGALNAALDPETLELRSGAPLGLSADDVRELKWHLTHFRDYQPGGLVSQADFAAGVCLNTPEEGVGLPLGAPRKTLAELMLAKDSGFAAVTEVESLEVGWSPEWKRVTTLFRVRTVRPIWSGKNTKEAPASFGVLMTGGFTTIAGVNICRTPVEASEGLRPGDFLFVWGELDPNNPGVMSQGHKLRVIDNKMDSRCAYCITEPDLSVEQLQQQLQGRKERR